MGMNTRGRPVTIGQLVPCVAAAVSDMANGGQILMESRTAEGVHDWLSDLGCVDHKGYNDKLLSSPVTFDNETNTSRVTR